MNDELEDLSTEELQAMMAQLTSDRAEVEAEYKRRQKLVDDELYRRQEEERLARLAAADGIPPQRVVVEDVSAPNGEVG